MSRSPKVRKEIRALEDHRRELIAELERLNNDPHPTTRQTVDVCWYAVEIDRINRKLDAYEEMPKGLTQFERERILSGDSLLSVLRGW